MEIGKAKKLSDQPFYAPVPHGEGYAIAITSDDGEIIIDPTVRNLHDAERLANAWNKTERESQSSKHCDAGWMNDARFGTEGDTQ